MTGTAEITRRLVHASGAVVPVAHLADVVTWPHVRYLLLAGALVTVGLEVVRLLVGLDWLIFEKLTRGYEQDNLAGYALYVFSMTAVAWLFEPKFAVPAMLMLTLGDPISGLIGSDELRTVKQWSVLAVMFLTCLALALGAKVVAFPDLPWVAIVAAAAAATLADGVKPVVMTHVVDDNLTIPIAAAVAGAFAAHYLSDVGTVALASAA